MRYFPLVLLLSAMCFAPGCTTKNMPLEAEGLVTLPVVPVIGSDWEVKRTQKYTVPRQVSPSGLEVAIGLPFTGLILPSWENDREYTKAEKRYPGWWRRRVTKELRVRKKKKKTKPQVIDGTVSE